MTEAQYKALLKLIVENSNRPLTDFEKEILKQGVDQAHSLEDFFSIAIASLLMKNHWDIMNFLLYE